MPTSTSSVPPTSTPSESIWDVIIIGSGFAGLAMGLALKKEPRTRFLILEQSDRPGGTWQVNRYPGCACDVPSHLYSLSQGPNWNWSQRYAQAPEIAAYLEQSSLPLQPHLRYGHEVKQAHWDPSGLYWNIQCSQGLFLARVLIAATGPLTVPHMPDLPGLADFSGPVIHSARWPRHLDLRGQRVGLIGTGASAIQIAPAIASQVAHLHIFQRTAPWIVPRGDQHYTLEWHHRWQRYPWLRRLYRYSLYWSLESHALAFMHRKLMRQVERRTLRLMAQQIKNPALLQQVTPTTPMGCKRILLSDDWWSTLQSTQVSLHTDPITSITAQQVHTASQSIPLTVIALATGYRYQDNPVSQRFIGSEGRSLADYWATQRGAFWGMMMPHFPNFFLMTGPFSGLGHNSIVFMIESQVSWIRYVLSWANKRQRTRFQVTEKAYADFMHEMHRRSPDTPWLGCHSWYLDEQGHNTALWPGYSWEYRWRLMRLNAEECLDG